MQVENKKQLRNFSALCNIELICCCMQVFGNIVRTSLNGGTQQFYLLTAFTLMAFTFILLFFFVFTSFQELFMHQSRHHTLLTQLLVINK